MLTNFTLKFIHSVLYAIATTVLMLTVIITGLNMTSSFFLAHNVMLE